MDNEILDQPFTNTKYKSLLRKKVYLIWASILILGLVFKLVHWPFSALLILLPSAVLLAYSLNGFVRRKERNVFNSIISLLGFIWMLFMIIENLMTGGDGYPFNQFGLRFFLIALFLSFGIYYFILYRKSKKN